MLESALSTSQLVTIYYIAIPSDVSQPQQSQMSENVLSLVSSLSGGLLSPSQVEDQVEQVRAVLGSASPASVQTETLKQLAGQSAQPGQFVR